VSGNSFVALDDVPFVFCGTLAAYRLGSVSIESLPSDIDPRDISGRRLLLL